MQQNEHSLIVTLIVLAVILPLFYFRMRKMTAERPLKLKYLWIRPVIFIALAVALLAGFPPATGDIPWLALAAVLGGGAGWQWGRTMAIHVHPEEGTLMAKGSQAAMMVFAALIVVRMVLRTGLQMEAEAWHLSPVFISDIFIVFAAMMFAVRGLEMFLRARRVMEQGGSHRA